MALVSMMVGDTIVSLTGTGAPLEERVNVAVKLCFLAGVRKRDGMQHPYVWSVHTYACHPFWTQV